MTAISRNASSIARDVDEKEEFRMFTEFIIHSFGIVSGSGDPQLAALLGKFRIHHKA